MKGGGFHFLCFNCASDNFSFIAPLGERLIHGAKNVYQKILYFYCPEVTLYHFFYQIFK
jgi:hypothetical protein